MEIIASPFVPSGVNYKDKCLKTTLSNFAPLQQVKYGISPNNVICNAGLELVFKSNDNSPTCVKPETVPKLIERGWGTTTFLTIQKTWVEINPVQCLGNPWEQDWLKSHNDDEASYPLRNTNVIKNYYKKQGVTVFDIKTRSWGGDAATCAGCGCSDGYTLYLLVSESVVDKMLNLYYKISN